jgi:murein DD-endopeptidase MepM/ murein hydrolase activator NlpD
MSGMNGRMNVLNIVAAVWIALFAFIVIKDFAKPGEASTVVPEELNASAAGPQITAMPESLIAPYTDYIVTQGPHGESYGHYAIDLTAGKDAPILSPISGVITDNYVDYLSNTVLVIENDIYTISLMHGKYSVNMGDGVTIGQVIGSESNIGNTIGFNGEPCYYYGLDCGYHTHLNIFDKRLGSNVNPLDVLPAQ